MDKFDITNSQVRENIKDYILIMLGAPVIKLELDSSHLDLCVTRTCDMMNASPRVAKWSDSVKLVVAQDGALAHAKMILGRIRAKYGGHTDAKGVKTKRSKPASTNTFGPIDGPSLLNEGERQYLSWQQKVFGKIED
jgi:hypothetical protein